MIKGNETLINVITPTGAVADTAAATSPWISVAEYEGQMTFLQNVGTISAGTLIGKIRDADDGAGANAADIPGALFATVTTSNDAPNNQSLTISSNVRPYVQYVGTLSAGTADLSVQLLANKKYST